MVTQLYCAFLVFSHNVLLQFVPIYILLFGDCFVPKRLKYFIPNFVITNLTLAKTFQHREPESVANCNDINRLTILSSQFRVTNIDPPRKTALVSTMNWSR